MGHPKWEVKGATGRPNSSCSGNLTQDSEAVLRGWRVLGWERALCGSGGARLSLQVPPERSSGMGPTFNFLQCPGVYIPRASSTVPLNTELPPEAWGGEQAVAVCTHTAHLRLTRLTSAWSLLARVPLHLFCGVRIRTCFKPLLCSHPGWRNDCSGPQAVVSPHHGAAPLPDTCSSFYGHQASC